MNKKGSIVIYMVFIISALFTVLLAGFLAPTGVYFNTLMYEAGEDLVIKANVTAQNITDENVKNRLTGIFESSLEASENNITVNNAMFKYGWIIAILLTGLILFLLTRSLVETRQGGGGLV